MDYHEIQQLAKALSCSVKDLIALTPENDPFYKGRDSDIRMAEWFADFYHAHFAPGTRVHLRRCHYKILSLGLPRDDGKAYENTDTCWQRLVACARAARYRGLVDVGMIEDHKHAPAVTQYVPRLFMPYLAVRTDDAEEVRLPALPAFPSYEQFGWETVHGPQPYHLEVWIEKSTMNDILLPLCQRYGMVLQAAEGELSITACYNLVKRVQQAGRPARIFYISDYDPGGQSMPVAVARKVEFFRQEAPGADIRLFPLALTAEQVQQYRLPRIPIKESERRKESFEARHGQGATELDALEALHPGELGRIVQAATERYYDVTLAERTRQAQAQIQEHLAAIEAEVRERYAAEIDPVQEEYAALVAEFAPRFAACREKLQKPLQAMADELQVAMAGDLWASMPDLAWMDGWLPVARPADELPNCLYDSGRSYLEQMGKYKRFQGKPCKGSA
jgi:hypothetical protein